MSQGDLENLLRVASIVEAAADSATLVGGLAVALSNVPEPDQRTRDLDVNVLRSLASFVRPTADIDAVVEKSQMEAAIEALNAAGFHAASSDGFRFINGAMEVDLLEGRRVEGAASAEAGARTIEVGLPEADRTRVMADGGEVVIAGVATLVVLKAVSAHYAGRGKRGSDLADIAVLALREQVHDTGAAATLRHWKGSMIPAVREALERTCGEFAGPAEAGPVAFAVVVRAGVAASFVEWAKEEKVVAEHASDAVRQLLAAFMAPGSR